MYPTYRLRIHKKGKKKNDKLQGPPSPAQETHIASPIKTHSLAPGPHGPSQSPAAAWRTPFPHWPPLHHQETHGHVLWSRDSFLSLQILVFLNQACSVQTDMQTHKIKINLKKGYVRGAPLLVRSHTFQYQYQPETLGFGGGAVSPSTAVLGKDYKLCVPQPPVLFNGFSEAITASGLPWCLSFLTGHFVARPLSANALQMSSG